MHLPASSSSLSTIAIGEKARVRCVRSNGQSLRLREMGFCEGQELEILRCGNPMICRVGANRLGICAELASHIEVTLSFSEPA